MRRITSDSPQEKKTQGRHYTPKSSLSSQQTKTLIAMGRCDKLPSIGTAILLKSG